MVACMWSVTHVLTDMKGITKEDPAAKPHKEVVRIKFQFHTYFKLFLLHFTEVEQSHDHLLQ